MPKAIQTKLISQYHNNLLASYLGIKKIRDLLAQKYFWLTLCRDVEAYVNGCNICLVSKIVWHKPYNNFQSLPISIYQWKNLLMDFVNGLCILTN